MGSRGKVKHRTPRPSPLGEGAPVRTLGRMRGRRTEGFRRGKQEYHVGNFPLFFVIAEEISTFPLIRHGFAVPPSPEGQCHQLKEPGPVFPVIARQCAHWRGNPFPLATSRFCTCYQGENGLPRRFAPNTYLSGC